MSDPHLHPEKGFNLSRWAVDHPALTRHLMAVLMILALPVRFSSWVQDEDPPFTFRLMVVRTFWPAPRRSRWPSR